MPTSNPTEDNKALVLAGIRGVFIDRDSTVLDRLFSDDYKQHNPQIQTGQRRSSRFCRTCRPISNTSPVSWWPTVTMSWFMAAMSDGDRSPWLGSIFSAWPMARSQNIGTFFRKRSRRRRAPTETPCSLGRRPEAAGLGSQQPALPQACIFASALNCLVGSYSPEWRKIALCRSGLTMHVHLLS